MRQTLLSALIVLLPHVALAEDVAIVPPVEGSLSAAEGLEAWDQVFVVASHPRCTNCHVGAQGQPMWEGLGYRPARVHGMNIRADESRIGAETIPCRTCHISAVSANNVPHAAPQIDDAWRLPPVELEWLGKTTAEVCAQLRDPETNDGMTPVDIAEHLRDSAFVNWGFEPGGGRETPPGDAATMINAVLAWGAAGMPCPSDQ